MNGRSAGTVGPSFNRGVGASIPTGDMKDDEVATALLVAMLLSGGDGGEHGGFLELRVGEQAVLEVPRVVSCTESSQLELTTLDRDHVAIVPHAELNTSVYCRTKKGERYGWLVEAREQRRCPGVVGDGGTIELEVGQAIVLKIPGVMRCGVGDASTHDEQFIDDDHVRVLAAGEGRSSVLCWGGDGGVYHWPLVIHPPAPRHDAPGLTELRRGEDAFIAAPGIRSARADDARVVGVHVEDGGVSVSAKGCGETDVRVKTSAGPIVHHFEVR